MNKILIDDIAAVERNSAREVAEEEEEEEQQIEAVHRIADFSDISSASSTSEIFSYNNNTREGAYQYW